MLLQDDVVDLLRGEEQLVKFESVGAPDDQKLFVGVWGVGVEVDPLELDDGIGVHPLGGDFCVEAELFDFDGSELVEVFGGGGVEEHADLGERVHVMLVLEYLGALHLFVGLPLLVHLVVLVLHLLRAVGHLDHHSLQPLHLNPADPQHALPVVPLLPALSDPAPVQHLVPDVPHVGLGLLAAFERARRALVPLLLENFDEGGELGPGGVVAAVVLFGQFAPGSFFGQLADGGVLLLDPALQSGAVLLFLDDYSHSFFFGPALAVGFIESHFFLEASLLLFATLFLLGLFLALLLFLQFLKLLLGQFGCGLRWHDKLYYYSMHATPAKQYQTSKRYL